MKTRHRATSRSPNPSKAKSSHSSRSISKVKKIAIAAVLIAMALFAAFLLEYYMTRNTDYLNVGGYTLYVKSPATSAYLPATHVSATFRVPAIMPISGTAEQMAFISNDKCWNYNSTGCKIIEGGTRTIFYNGSFRYLSFYYIYPGLYFPLFDVNPNDTMHVNITETSKYAWNVNITDYTSGKSMSSRVYFTLNGTWANFGMTDWLIDCKEVIKGNKTITFINTCTAGAKVAYADPTLGFYDINATLGNETYNLCTADLLKRDIVYPTNTLNLSGIVSKYEYRIVPYAYPYINSCGNFTIAIR